MKMSKFDQEPDWQAGVFLTIVGGGGGGGGKSTRSVIHVTSDSIVIVVPVRQRCRSVQLGKWDTQRY